MSRARASAGAAVALTLVAGGLFAIRLAGQPNYLDNEYRLGAFVLNAVQGGEWLAPHDLLGNMYKPPMLTWLAALVALATGHVDRFSLYLPTALATLGVAWLAFVAGRDHFGARAGFFGGLCYLLSYVASHQMATARWDGLFAFAVTLTAIAGLRAVTRGRGWTGFWLAAAFATLTKGPLGVLLAGFGFLAIPWERRSGRRLSLGGSHRPGFALFAFLTLGWCAAAYWRMGSHLFDDMFRQEFVGHIVMNTPGHRFWKVPNDFLTNFAPWSVFAVVGLWRTVRSPAADEPGRLFERFCFCWLTAGLLLFALSPHNPSRLLDPIFPPAAMLAGRELDRLASRLAPRQLAIACATAIVVAFAMLALQARHFERESGKTKETVAMFDLRRTVEGAVGGDFPLSYAVDVPFATQLAFETMRPKVTYRRAAALLRDPAPAYVVVSDVAHLRRRLGRNPPPVYEVASATIAGVPYLHVVGNRDRLARLDPFAVAVGPLRLRLSGLRLGPTQDGRIVVGRGTGPGSLDVINGVPRPVTLVLRVEGEPSRPAQELAPRATLHVAVD